MSFSHQNKIQIQWFHNYGILIKAGRRASIGEMDANWTALLSHIRPSVLRGKSFPARFGSSDDTCRWVTCVPPTELERRGKIWLMTVVVWVLMCVCIYSWKINNTAAGKPNEPGKAAPEVENHSWKKLNAMDIFQFQSKAFTLESFEQTRLVPVEWWTWHYHIVGIGNSVGTLKFIP